MKPYTTEQLREIWLSTVNLPIIFPPHFQPVIVAVKAGDWFMLADWIEEFGTAESQYLAPIIRGE